MKHDVAPPETGRAELAEVGVLNRTDLHLAEAIGRLTGETDEQVLLAIALASRAPRHGHVCVHLSEVAERVEIEPDVETPIQISWPETTPWLQALQASPAVRSGEDEDRVAPLVVDAGRLYLDRFWRYEQRLEAELDRRSAGVRGDVDVEVARRRLAELFPGSADELDRQALAAAVACLRDLTVISGAPGTGKTSTVVRLLALLRETVEPADPIGGVRIAMAAPTGKAAVRMQEAVREALVDLPAPDEVCRHLADLEAGTLHRLLGWQPQNPSRFRHNADNPLPYDVVVVDEASMVPLALMSKLVDAVPRGARLVLVGDRDQLASVEAGSVLGDICGPVRSRGEQSLRLSPVVSERLAELTTIEDRSYTQVGATGVWDSIVHLEHFYRFGSASGIGAVARAIQSGEDEAERTLAIFRDEYDDIAISEPVEGEALPDDVRARIVDGYRPYLEAVLAGAPATEILRHFDEQRVLCAVRRGPQGVEALNDGIESWLAEALHGFRPRSTWYLGRPVMVTQNDYGVGLFNGDVGIVVGDPGVPGRRVVAFPKVDGGVRLLSPSRIPAVETVFATTVHKAQGSQYGRVVVVLPQVSSPILTRELVYTAMTRAREHVMVVASDERLREAVSRPIQRSSGLADRLWA
jgi:exodeoxyribonuclease V alpha subunit